MVTYSLTVAAAIEILTVNVSTVDSVLAFAVFALSSCSLHSSPPKARALETMAARKPPHIGLIALIVIGAVLMARGPRSDRLKTRQARFNWPPERFTPDDYGRGSRRSVATRGAAPVVESGRVTGSAPTPRPGQPSLIERRARRIANARSVTVGLAVTFVAFALVGAVLMRIADPHNFPSFGLAVWWALQTITTVG
jgi:hypothetical protein